MPHGKNLILIDSLLEAKENSVIATARAGSHPSILLTQSDTNSKTVQKVSSMSGIEYIVQAAGLAKVYGSFKAGDLRLKQAAVIRARKFIFQEQTIEKGTKLLIKASWSSSMINAFEVQGEIFYQESPKQLILSGNITVFEFE